MDQLKPSYNLHLAKHDNCCSLSSTLKLLFKCLTNFYIYVQSMQGILHRVKGKTRQTTYRPEKGCLETTSPTDKDASEHPAASEGKKKKKHQQVSATIHFSFLRQLCSFVQGLVGI